jgi:2-(1,2-epoxy-1,2-dihydrophenyl)acetyl-CoA isomerase
MMHQETQVSVTEDVAIVTMSRPERLNAYTPDMGVELVAAFRSLLEDESIRSIILTGAGRGFCAGADRDYVSGKRGRTGFKLGEEYFIQGFVAELANAEKPLIAAINGPASGIGVTMILPFDVRVACNEATFGFPFVKWGLMPGMGASYFLPRLVGESQARVIMLSGATIDARLAHEIGLIDEIATSSNLKSRAISLAKSLTGGSRDIVAACKRAFNRGVRRPLLQAMAQEKAEIAQLAEKRGR